MSNVVSIFEGSVASNSSRAACNSPNRASGVAASVTLKAMRFRTYSARAKGQRFKPITARSNQRRVSAMT